MNIELKALQEAIRKKPRHNKRHARSAGIDEIRRCFAEYKKSLDKSWLARWREKVGLK